MITKRAPHNYTEALIGTCGRFARLQPFDAAFDGRSRGGQRLIEGLFGGGEFPQGLAFDAGAQPRAGALVGEIAQSTSTCGKSSAAGWITNEAPEQRD